MDHLKDAREFADAAECADDDALANRHAQLATAHALIAQAEASRALVALTEQLLERLPRPAETCSERFVRLRKEEK